MSSPRTQESSPEQWAIYMRVSTRHQAEKGFSLQDQRERLVAYAAERGWSYRVFEDAGVSGETLIERPALVSMLEMAEAGELEGVLIVDESRLGRTDLVSAIITEKGVITPPYGQNIRVHVRHS